MARKLLMDHCCDAAIIHTQTGTLNGGEHERLVITTTLSRVARPRHARKTADNECFHGQVRDLRDSDTALRSIAELMERMSVEIGPPTLSMVQLCPFLAFGTRADPSTELHVEVRGEGNRVEFDAPQSLTILRAAAVSLGLPRVRTVGHVVGDY